VNNKVSGRSLTSFPCEIRVVVEMNFRHFDDGFSLDAFLKRLNNVMNSLWKVLHPP